MKKIVYYVNQFYGQIGGEEAADQTPIVKEGSVGPAVAMQEALKDIFGPMFDAMLQGEMNSHLGYPNNGRGEKETVNRRNGYSKKL